VDGSGTFWSGDSDLTLGYSGTGNLTVTNGGSVYTGGYGYLGYLSGSAGTVNVGGSGSNWSYGGGLYVGYLGTGTMHITSGGTVSGGSGNLGCNNGQTGTVTVDGAASTWSVSGNLFVGYGGNGVLKITNGGLVTSNSGLLALGGSGTTGAGTVDGSGSQWNISGNLVLGFSSAGTLNITNGGQVTVGGTTSFTSTSSSSATLNFGTSGGTLTTGSLSLTSLTAPSQLLGTGTINARGLVCDGDLVFDVTHGLSRTLLWNGTGQNVTCNLDLTGNSGTTGNLGAGYRGTGTLTIRDGVKVTSASGVLGLMSGSTGTATVTGTGSAWNNVTSLNVGSSGLGTLNITAGGSVTASSGMITTSSLLAVNVGDGSVLNLGTGTLANNGGTIRLTAVSGLIAGSTYTPIIAGSWSETGTTQAIGGIWNSTTHVFTVSPVGDNGSWNGSAGTSWSNSANWTGITTAVPGTGRTATFNTASSNTTIDLGTGLRQVKTLMFDIASAASYTIGSGAVGSQALELDHTGGILVNAPVVANQTVNANVVLGDATASSYVFTNSSSTSLLTIAGNIQGGSGGSAGKKTLSMNGVGTVILSGSISDGSAQSVGLVIANAGTTILSGANTYTGGTTVTGGVLTFATANSRPAADVLSVGMNGSLTPPGAIVILKTGETADQIRQELQSVATGGLGTIKPVTGTPSTQGIGYLAGSIYNALHPGNNLGLGTNDIVLKYTYLGDVNLDGRITATDFAQLDAAYFKHYYNGGLTDPKATWLQGDLNFDGQINATDFAIMDASYLAQTAGTLANDPFYVGNLATFGPTYASLVAQQLNSVPEPASLALLGFLGVGCLLGHRQRDRSRAWRWSPSTAK
ncbi:MAG: dockerin type I domain-containing protein, partial [Phycisphaerae bacterium]